MHFTAQATDCFLSRELGSLIGNLNLPIARWNSTVPGHSDSIGVRVQVHSHLPLSSPHLSKKKHQKCQVLELQPRPTVSASRLGCNLAHGLCRHLRCGVILLSTKSTSWRLRGSLSPLTQKPTNFGRSPCQTGRLFVIRPRGQEAFPSRFAKLQPRKGMKRSRTRQNDFGFSTRPVRSEKG